MTDKKDQISKLLKQAAESPAADLFDAESPWAELGKQLADSIREHAESPRLSGMEMLLLRIWTRDNEIEKLAPINDRYMSRCNWYAETYGSDKLWTAVDPAYDKLEYRERLKELGREVNVANLFTLMDERHAQLLP